MTEENVVQLIPHALTFNAVYDAYVSLLAKNPGKALLLPNDGVIIMLDGEPCSSSLVDGVIDMENASCIDPRAWCESERCWYGDEDWDVTAAAVNQPQFIDLQ